jgi:hypothetical protein
MEHHMHKQMELLVLDSREKITLLTRDIETISVQKHELAAQNQSL